MYEQEEVQVRHFIETSCSLFGNWMELTDCRSVNETTCTLNVRFPPPDLRAPYRTAWMKDNFHAKAQWHRSYGRLIVSTARPFRVRQDCFRWASGLADMYNETTNIAKFVVQSLDDGTKVRSYLRIDEEGVEMLRQQFCMVFPTFCAEAAICGLEIESILRGSMRQPEPGPRPLVS